MKHKLLWLILLPLLLWPMDGWAARQTNGTNQSLQSASNLSLGSPTKIAVSFWLWWDSFANDSDRAMEYTADYNSNFPAFIVLPNRVTGEFEISNSGPGPLYSQGLFTRPTAGVWHHYLFDVDNALSTNEMIDVFVDGSSQSLTRTVNNDTSGGFVDSLLNLMSQNNTAAFGAGRIAEVAIWAGVNLTSTDATDLFNGTKLPVNIQIGSLKYYWKLCGNASPEPSTVGGINMTVNGATSVAHPSAVSVSCARSSSMLLGVGR